nr:retrovirus-related Pol polyprotein from transposon TNT 1-94 [Tanacetum cinerariifolium]
MAMISTFITVDKTAHNSHKFAFNFSPTDYGYWKTMIEPFLITNNLMGYFDGLQRCPNHGPSTIRTRPSANFANTYAQSSNVSANWHSDTGANSHVTRDLEAMDNSEAYYGDDVQFDSRCHVVETSLTFLAQACVPQRFWHNAFDTAVYLINHMPYRTSTNKSPFEHIFKRSPDYSFLRVVGCLCFLHLRPYNHHQMDLRSTLCVFLGYSPSHHGYCCLDISTERLYITRRVRFNEAQFPFDIPKTTSSPPSKTSHYYSSKSPYVIPTTDHPSPSSPCLPISSPSLVSHLSPTSQTSLESSNGQLSPVSITSIPKPSPPPPTPPPPPIT